MEINEAKAEELFENLTASSASGTGEEELLRIASKFSKQVSMRQIRKLIILKVVAPNFSNETVRQGLKDVVDIWIEYKQYHQSNGYVMAALDAISLRKFINDQTMKINLNKS